MPGAGSRSSFGLAYDAARRRLVLYGGFGTGNFDRTETWEWDGTSWSSTATLHGCVVRGGSATLSSFSGATAAVANASVLIATGSSFIGGNGAPGGNAGTFYIPPGNGGDAIALHNGAAAYLLGCTLSPGAAGTPGTGCPPGTPGQSVGGTGTANFLPGPAATLTTNSPVRTGQVATFDVGGPAGSGAPGAPALTAA